MLTVLPIEESVHRLVVFATTLAATTRVPPMMELDAKLMEAWLDFIPLRDKHEAAFADTLRHYRQRASLKQAALAEKTGIGEKTLSTFETGARVRSITFDQLRLILAACEGDLETFYKDVRAW